MFSFRPSVHSTVRPSTNLVVGPSARMQFSSLMHVCMSVIFLISNSGSSSKLGHVGSKTRSLGRILEKPCVHSRGHRFDHKFMELCQNVNHHNI